MSIPQRKKTFSWDEKARMDVLNLFENLTELHPRNYKAMLYDEFMKIYPNYYATKEGLAAYARKYKSQIISVNVQREGYTLTKDQENKLGDLYLTINADKNITDPQKALYDQFMECYPDYTGSKQVLWIDAVRNHKNANTAKAAIQENSNNFALHNIFEIIEQQLHFAIKVATKPPNPQRFVINKFREHYKSMHHGEFEVSDAFIFQKFFEWNQVKSPLKVASSSKEIVPQNEANMNELRLKAATQYLKHAKAQAESPIFKESCHNCGLMFFRNSENNTTRCLLNEPLHGKPMVLKHFNNNTDLPPFISKKGKYITCKFCKENPNLHDYYDRYLPGTKTIGIPEELKLNSEYAKSQLALCGIFGTIKERGNKYRRSFDQYQGHVNAGKKLDKSYYGAFATYYNIVRPDSNSESNQEIRTALLWLKKNNHLYGNFLSNYETLYGYLTRELNVNVNDTTIALAKGNFQELVNRERKGVIIPADNAKIVNQLNPSEDQIAIQHPIYNTAKEAFEYNQNMIKVNYADKDLDAKCWPIDHPTGKGSYTQDGPLKHRQYWKWNVLNFDSRFRKNTERHFFTFDRYLKNKLFYYNKVGKVMNKKDIPTEVTAGDLNNHEGYYGTEVPSDIPGSRSYWQTKSLELLATIRELGSPALFVTITQNDNWPELQIASENMTKEEYDDFAENVFRPPPITGESVHTSPVEAALAFQERFKIFLKNFVHSKTGPFGTVKDFWYRLEYQERGAIHCHMLLWTDDYDQNCILAEKPRYSGNDIELVKKNDILRQYVESFQIHNCRPNRCFKTNTHRATKKCKYGFRFKICDETILPEDEVRYLYQRRQEEDAKVIPYSPELLLTMQAHVNIQRVTPRNLEMYLCKYVTKPESSVDIRKVGNDVDRFLKSRVVGILECINILMEFRQCMSSREVIFLPCNVNPEYRMLKRKLHLPTNPESTDIFYGNNLDKYLDRPIALKDLTYPEFFKWWSVTSKKTMAEDPDRDFTQILQFTQSLTATQALQTPRGQDYFEIGSKRYTKRSKFAVTRYRFLLPFGDNAEKYYEQQFLLKVPIHRSDLRKFPNAEDFWFSKSNQSRTFMEECMIRQLVNPVTDVKDVLTKAINHGFTEEKLMELARHMVNQNWILESEVDSLLQPFVDKLPKYDNAEFGGLEEQEFYENLMEMFGNKVDIEPLEKYKESMTDSQLKAIEWFEEKLKTGEQILACISGGGGVGKSFLLKAIYALFREHELKSSITAPTAAAAYLVGGTTVHNFIKMDIHNNCYIQNGTTAALIVQNTDNVFLDEFGMSSFALFDQLDAILSKYPPVSRESNNRPFNGRNCILLGDPAQLESIDPNSILSHPLLHEFKILLLKEIVRQPDQAFAEMLSRIRLGVVNEEDDKTLRSRLIKPDDVEYSDTSTVIVSKNVRRDYWNSKFLEKLDGDEITIEAQDFNESSHLPIEHKGVLSMIKKFGKNLLPDVLKLKKNAVIVLTKRIGEVHEGWPPGMMAKIVCIGENRDYIIIESMDGKNRRIPLRKMRQEIQLRGRFNNKYYRVQFPIVLGYSQSIHRIQGQSLPNKVYIELDESLWASGQAYCALSRCTKLENLHLLTYQKSAVKLHPEYLNILKWMESVDEIGEIKLPRSPHDFPLIPYCENTTSIFPDVAPKPSTSQQMPVNPPIPDEMLPPEIATRLFAKAQEIKEKLQVLKTTRYVKPAVNIYEQEVLISTYSKTDHSLPNSNNSEIQSLECQLENIQSILKVAGSNKHKITNQPIQKENTTPVQFIAPIAGNINVAAPVKFSEPADEVIQISPMKNIRKSARIKQMSNDPLLERVNIYKEHPTVPNNQSDRLRDDPTFHTKFIRRSDRLVERYTSAVNIAAMAFQEAIDLDRPKTVIMNLGIQFADVLFDFLNALYGLTSNNPDPRRHLIAEQVKIGLLLNLRPYKRQLEYLKNVIRSQQPTLYSTQQKDKISPNMLPNAINDNYQAVKTEADGNCFYNAISLCLFGSEKWNKVIRLILANDISIARDDWQQLWQSVYSFDQYDQFLLKILGYGAWADQDVGFAMSNLIQRPIFVYSEFPASGSVKNASSKKLQELMSTGKCGIFHNTYLFDDRHKHNCPVVMHHVHFQGLRRPYVANHFTSLLPLGENSNRIEPNNQFYKHLRGFNNVPVLEMNPLETIDLEDDEVENVPVESSHKRPFFPGHRAAGGGLLRNKKFIALSVVALLGGVLTASYAYFEAFWTAVQPDIILEPPIVGVPHGSIIDDSFIARENYNFAVKYALKVFTYFFTKSISARLGNSHITNHAINLIVEEVINNIMTYMIV